MLIGLCIFLMEKWLMYEKSGIYAQQSSDFLFRDANLG